MDRWAGWDSNWLRVVLILLTLGALWAILLSALVPDSAFVDLFVAPAIAFMAMVALPIITVAVSNNKRLLMAFTAFYIFVSVAVWRNRDFSDTSLDLQILLQFAFWSYGALLGILNLPIILNRANDFLVLTVLAMLALVVVSPLWSPTMSYSAMSAALNVMFFLFAFTVAHKLTEREMVWVITFACLLVVVPSLAMSPFRYSFAEVTGEGTAALDRLRGVTGHPIALAVMCAVLMICSVSIFYNRWGSRIFPLVFMGFAIATILLTQSRMPLVAALFACLAVPAYRLRVLGPASGPIFILFAILALVTAVSGLEYIVPAEILASLSRSGEAKEILSLTGRSLIWEFAVSKIAERPVLGWGVGSGAAVILPDFPDPTMNVMHSHNAILHFTLSTGVVGGMLMVTAFAIMVYRSFKYGSMFASTLVVMLLVAGVTEAVYANNRPNMTTFFLYAAIGICAQLGPKSAFGSKTPHEPVRRRTPRRPRVNWDDPPEGAENSPA